jgi:hypothetical protein
MEAAIKKDQQKLEVLDEIGAIAALKECASSPDELAARFASDALTIIGEEVPYKLSQQVPCWTIKDVQVRSFFRARVYLLGVVNEFGWKDLFYLYLYYLFIKYFFANFIN